METRQDRLTRMKAIGIINQDNVNETADLLCEAIYNGTTEEKNAGIPFAANVFISLLEKPIDLTTWHITINKLAVILEFYGKHFNEHDQFYIQNARKKHCRNLKETVGKPASLDQRTFAQFIAVIKKPHRTRASLLIGFAKFFIERGVLAEEMVDRETMLRAIPKADSLGISLGPHSAFGALFHTYKKNIDGLSADELKDQAATFTRDMQKIRSALEEAREGENGVEFRRMMGSVIKDEFIRFGSLVPLFKFADKEVNPAWSWKRILELVNKGVDPNTRFGLLAFTGIDSNAEGLPDILVSQLRENKPFPPEIASLLECGLDPDWVYSIGMPPRRSATPLKVVLEKRLERLAKNEPVEDLDQAAILLLQFGAKPQFAGDIAFDFIVEWLLSLKQDTSLLTPILVVNAKEDKPALLAAMKRMDRLRDTDAIEWVFDKPGSALARVCLAGHIDPTYQSGKTKLFRDYYEEKMKAKKDQSVVVAKNPTMPSVLSSIGSFFGFKQEEPKKTFFNVDVENKKETGEPTSALANNNRL